jgi:hypothetical protein
MEKTHHNEKYQCLQEFSVKIGKVFLVFVVMNLFFINHSNHWEIRELRRGKNIGVCCDICFLKSAMNKLDKLDKI